MKTTAHCIAAFVLAAFVLTSSTCLATEFTVTGQHSEASGDTAVSAPYANSIVDSSLPVSGQTGSGDDYSGSLAVGSHDYARVFGDVKSSGWPANSYSNAHPRAEVDSTSDFTQRVQVIVRTDAIFDVRDVNEPHAGSIARCGAQFNLAGTLRSTNLETYRSWTFANGWHWRERLYENGVLQFDRPLSTASNGSTGNTYYMYPVYPSTLLPGDVCDWFAKADFYSTQNPKTLHMNSHVTINGY